MPVCVCVRARVRVRVRACVCPSLSPPRLSAPARRHDGRAPACRQPKSAVADVRCSPSSSPSAARVTRTRSPWSWRGPQPRRGCGAHAGWVPPPAFPSMLRLSSALEKRAGASHWHPRRRARPSRYKCRRVASLQKGMDIGCGFQVPTRSDHCWRVASSGTHGTHGFQVPSRSEHALPTGTHAPERAPQSLMPCSRLLSARGDGVVLWIVLQWPCDKPRWALPDPAWPLMARIATRSR